MPTDNSNAFSPQDLTRTEDQNRAFPNARGQVDPAIESAPEEPQDWKTPMAEPAGGWQQGGDALTFEPRPKEVNKILNSKHVLSDVDTSDPSNARVFVANFLNSKYDEDKRGIYKDYEGKTKAYGLSGDPVADAKSILDGDTKTHESSQTRIAKDRKVIAEGLDKLGYEERQGFGANAKNTFDRGFLDLGVGTAAQGALKGIESMGDEMERIERGLFEDLGITYYDEELGGPVTSEDVQKWREDVRERNTVDPEFLNSYTGGVIQGYGQAAAIVPAFLLNPAVGTGMSVAQAYQYGEDGYRDFVKSEGITYEESEARKAGLWNMPSAAVDVIANRFAIGKILKPLKGAKITKGGALEFLKDTAESAAMGSGTEGVQTVWENLNAKYLSGYDRDKVLTDGVVDAMVIGAFVDSTITAGGQGVTKGVNKLLGKTMDPVEGMTAVDWALALNVVPEAEFAEHVEREYGDEVTEDGVPLAELAWAARGGDRKAAQTLVDTLTLEVSVGAKEAGLTPAEAEARGKEAAEVADPVEPLVETPIDKEISTKKEELVALEEAEDSTPEDMKSYEKLDKEIQALETKRVEEIVKGKMMTPFTRGVEAEQKRVEQARLDKADKELEEQDQVIDLINILSPLSINTTVENMPELAAGGAAIIQGWKDAGFSKKEIAAKSKELMTAQGMPNTRLEDVVQKGSQKSTKTGGGPIQSLIKLFKGANPFTVVEEFAHAEYDREIAEGTVTVEQVREWRKAIEKLTDTPDLRGETDEDIKEWVAEQVKARIYGQRNNLSLPESFLKFLDDIISGFKQILGRAKELQDLEASGQLPTDFLEMLDRQGLVGKPQQPLGPETESGTAGPDTPVESLDGEGPEIEWKADESFSIEVDRNSYPTITPEIFDTIQGETDTLGVIHIDRMIAGGDYEGVPLQGGMFYPSITENLENNVVWAFNSLGVANDVIDRARKNGGYLQLVLMNEGNVVGNKTFTTIWFNEVNKSIAEGRTTEAKALEFLNAQREAASKLKTKIKFRHTEEWKSVAEASEAIISMPQLARGVFYASRGSANTKARGKHVTYGKMLSAKASKALGLPSTESLVEKLEEPAFKGLPADSIVAVIKIDTDQPAMSAQEAGVTPHLSYGYVVKGKPVAKMKKAPVLTDAFPHLKNKLMSAGQFQSPASLLEEESYSLEPLSEQDADAEATVAAEERQSRTPERQAFIDYQRELRRTQLDNTEEEKEKLQKLLQLATDADEIAALKQAGDEKIIRVVEQKVKQIRKQAAEREDVTESVKALERLINSPEVPMEVRARMRGIGRLVERKTPQGKARWIEYMANKLEAEIDRHYRTRNVRALRSFLRPFATQYAPNRRKLRKLKGEEARIELDFAQRLLNNGEATPPAGMTDARRDELVDIFGDVGNRQSSPTRVAAALDIAKGIAGEGRKVREEFEQDRRERNAAVGGQVVAQVLNTEDALDDTSITANERDQWGITKAFKSVASLMIRGMEGFQQQLNKLDRIKGGVLETMFLSAAHNAHQTELAMNIEHAEQTRDDFATVLGPDNRVAAKWYKGSHEVHQTDIEWINNKKVGMVKRKLSKQQGVSLLMQWLDPSLRSTFLNMGIDGATIEQVKEFIGEIGVSEAYYFREKYAEMGIKLNAKHMEIEGIPLDMIDGYGGRARRQGAKTKEEDMQMFARNSAGRPTVKSGSMKERTNSNDYLMFMDADLDFTAHAKEVNHYISHAELARNLTAAFLTNEDARNAIKQKHGSKFYKSLADQVEMIIAGRPTLTDTQKFWTKGRALLTKGTLMVKPAIMFKQLTSAPAFIEEIGPVAYTKAGTAMMKPENLAKFLPMIWGSEYVKNRRSTSQYADIQQSLDARQNVMKGMRVSDWVMMNVKIGDIGAVVMGGAPVYYHAYTEAKAAGMTNDQAQAKAEEVFGLASERAQQSSAGHAQGSFLKGQGLARSWFMYQTSPLQYQRNVNTSIANWVAQAYEWKNDRPSDAKKAAIQAVRAISIYHFILPQIFQAVASGLVGFTDDEDYIKDKFWARQRRAAYLGNLNTFPALGTLLSGLANIISGADETFRSSGSPIIDIFTKTAGQFNTAIKNGDDMDAWINLGAELAQARGIPVKTVRSYYEAITDVSEGNTENPLLRLLGWSKWSLFED